MKKIQHIVFYLFSFAFARGILFICPILLANLLPRFIYGTVEWAYAAGSLVSVVVTVGTIATIPVIKLQKAQFGSLAGVLAHNVWLFLVCAILLIVLFFQENNEVLFLTILFVVSISLQSLWSTHLKTQGKSELSLIVDAGVFALMTVTVITLNYFHITSASALIFIKWIVGGYAVCLFVVTLFALFECISKGEVINYFTAVSLGFPLMITSLMTIAITTSGRLAVGYLGGASLTADYAILARAATLTIIAHQIIVVAKYKHLFTLSDKEMERVIIFILGMVGLSVIVLAFLFPFLGWMLGPVFVRTFNDYTLAGFWVLAQSILWSGIALNDLINTRYQTANRVLKWNIIFLVVSIPIAALVIKNINITLNTFIYGHGMLMLLFYMVQAIAMYRAGIRLMRVWSLAIGAYIAFVFTASWWYLY